MFELSKIMITLKRKAELLTNHLRVVELMSQLTSTDYLESDDFGQIVSELLKYTNISPEERDWLLGQTENHQEA
jgi:hypothetical protein